MMVESLERSKSNAKKDIPPMGRLKKVIHACQWKEVFNYPLESIPVADYYVVFEHILHVGAVWIIEASTKNLHKKIKQIESSADFFKKEKINVDGYLIVLDSLSRRSQKKYILKSATNIPLKIIKEKIGNNNNRQYKILNKPLFVVYRKEFRRFRK